MYSPMENQSIRHRRVSYRSGRPLEVLIATGPVPGVPGTCKEKRMLFRDVSVMLQEGEIRVK